LLASIIRKYHDARFSECQNSTISFPCSTFTYCLHFLSCVCDIPLLKYRCFHLHAFFKNVKKKMHKDENLTFVVGGHIWVKSSRAVSCIDKEWIFERLGGCHRLLSDGYCDTHMHARAHIQACSRTYTQAHTHAHAFRGEGRTELGV